MKGLGKSERLSDVLHYLQLSHEYYTGSALKELSQAFDNILAPVDEGRRMVFRKFFADYRKELEDHFAYEEGMVIPYVQKLLLGQRTEGVCLDDFEDDHSNIDEKLEDLKNLVVRYLPEECDAAGKIDLLDKLNGLQVDIRCHASVEEDVLEPLVKLLESGEESDFTAVPLKEELSDREKEILVSVAEGLLNKEIADRHNISVNTVITHRKNITRKIGIKTVAGLTAYAILNNLIDINSIK